MRGTCRAFSDISIPATLINDLNRAFKTIGELSFGGSGKGWAMAVGVGRELENQSLAHRKGCHKWKNQSLDSSRILFPNNRDSEVRIVVVGIQEPLKFVELTPWFLASC